MLIASNIHGLFWVLRLYRIHALLRARHTIQTTTTRRSIGIHTPKHRDVSSESHWRGTSASPAISTTYTPKCTHHPWATALTSRPSAEFWVPSQLHAGSSSFRHKSSRITARNLQMGSASNSSSSGWVCCIHSISCILCPY